MLAGEIIKFHRQRAGLTQEDLGKGICSVTHVSKIERGVTPYSSEIIQMFSERLNLDIDQEINRFANLGERLQHWHKTIIMQNMKEAEKIKKELEGIPISLSSSHAAFYELLLARLHLKKLELEQAEGILIHIQNGYPNLQAYEQNMLKHAWGIYYILRYRDSKAGNYHKAIEFLKDINMEEYGNHEYYYHLAAAYYWTNSKIAAYAYANKALVHFRETDNYIGAITAESLMLAQEGNDLQADFNELEKSYQRLIRNCDLLNLPNKKSLLLNNLGYEYWRRKEYRKAQTVLEEALGLVAKPSALYLQRLQNYINACLEGKLLRKAVLLKRAREGMSMTKNLENRFYKIIFKLLILRIEEQSEQYYRYIEYEALPYFLSISNAMFTNRFGKQLYQYYVETEQYEKAVQVSNIFIESIACE
ncbi:helix-turn-helix domain-containing protein [Cytobacillus firmus]|uniref:helix-turn-helix domain-containing protein n=1 Tax=Cytobacillus firmus TaxID=1399 RepID=UPI00384ACD5B